MKSKRQEELPKKTLSPQIYGWEAFYQRFGTRILLGLTLIVLAILVVRYRNTTAQQREISAKAMAVRAREDLRTMRQEMQLASAPVDILAARRDQLFAQVMADLSVALSDSSDTDTTLKASAYATRGDLYWTLANSPVFPQATTRPSLALKDTPDSLLSEAEADYKHVIDQYPHELMPWAISEFGLAAIAENRGNWDEARKRYEEVENRSDSPDMLKSTAQMRLGLLERIRQPMYVGSYPATAPTTQLDVAPTDALSPFIAAPTTTATSPSTPAPTSAASTQPAG